MKIEDTDLNIIFELIQSVVDNKFYLEKKPKFFEINAEILEGWQEWLDCEYELEDDDSIYDILEYLTGWEVKVTQHGDHKHDGQMVTYKFSFKNKEGELIKVETDRCLMMGWNHHEDVEI